MTDPATESGPATETRPTTEQPIASAPHRPGGMFNTQSDRLPATLAARLMRLWIPLGLCAIGIVLLITEDFDGFGVSAFACFVGAGSSAWLINFLWRLGVSGDDERDLEANDRNYLATHGHWPDQDDQSRPS